MKHGGEATLLSHTVQQFNAMAQALTLAIEKKSGVKAAFEARFRGGLLGNDYLEAHAVCDAALGLYAVKLSDGGWGVADGPGSRLSAPDEQELAGFHLPVRFESQEAAAQAIASGPFEFFDLAVDGFWARHCLAAGGVFFAPYSR